MKALVGGKPSFSGLCLSFHFAYGRIALTLGLLGQFGRFIDENDRCNPPGALNQKLTVLS